MAIKQLSRQEIIKLLTEGLKSGRLKHEAATDSEGNILWISIVPADLPPDDPRRRHTKDRRQTRPL